MTINRSGQHTDTTADVSPAVVQHPVWCAPEWCSAAEFPVGGVHSSAPIPLNRVPVRDTMYALSLWSLVDREPDVVPDLGLHVRKAGVGWAKAGHFDVDLGTPLADVLAAVEAVRGLLMAAIPAATGRPNRRYARHPATARDSDRRVAADLAGNAATGPATSGQRPDTGADATTDMPIDYGALTECPPWCVVDHELVRRVAPDLSVHEAQPTTLHTGDDRVSVIPVRPDRAGRIAPMEIDLFAEGPLSVPQARKVAVHLMRAAAFVEQQDGPRAPAWP